MFPRNFRARSASWFATHEDNDLMYMNIDQKSLSSLMMTIRIHGSIKSPAENHY